ncbi:MAG TPA: hypothetical protein VER14_07430, partial [Phototrophicaceae bacterium]|nr:hypothetical protein [Phototrophicaceae bacterium]
MKLFLVNRKKNTVDEKINGILDLQRKDKGINGDYQRNLKTSVFDIDYSKVRSNKTKEKLEKLQGYSYPIAAKTRLKEKFPFTDMDEEDIDLCIVEFKKYIGLRIIRRFEKSGPYANKESASASVAMTSEIIDEVWHNLILFTRDYHEFSLLVYGEYLHHLPAIAAYSSPITDTDVKMFIKAYKEYFGTINSLWYYKINKNIKDNSKNNIYNTGNINCISNGIGGNIDDSCNNLIDGNTFSFTHGTSQKGYPDPQSENMFARIDSNTFLYYLSMNSEIYAIEAGLQMLDFADGDVNFVSAY